MVFIGRKEGRVRDFAAFHHVWTARMEAAPLWRV